MFSPPTTPPKFSLPTQVHVLSLSRSLKQNTENQNKERNSKTKDAKQNKTKQKAYKTNKQEVHFLLDTGVCPGVWLTFPAMCP